MRREAVQGKRERLFERVAKKRVSVEIIEKKQRVIGREMANKVNIKFTSGEMARHIMESFDIIQNTME